MITLLTFLNSIGILVIFFKIKIIDVTIRRDQTCWNETLTGYDVWVWKTYFRVPIRNKRKTELNEEVHRLITKESQQNKLQTLSAKFSWLKTWEEVRQFEKDYSVVDQKIVADLVSGFKEINDPLSCEHGSYRAGHSPFVPCICNDCGEEL